MIIAGPLEKSDTAGLLKLIVDHGITFMALIASLLRRLVEEVGLDACTSLRHVVCFGEPLPSELEASFCRRLRSSLGIIYGTRKRRGWRSASVGAMDRGRWATWAFRSLEARSIFWINGSSPSRSGSPASSMAAGRICLPAIWTGAMGPRIASSRIRFARTPGPGCSKRATGHGGGPTAHWRSWPARRSSEDRRLPHRARQRSRPHWCGTPAFGRPPSSPGRVATATIDWSPISRRGRRC